MRYFVQSGERKEEVEGKSEKEAAKEFIRGLVEREVCGFSDVVGVGKEGFNVMFRKEKFFSTERILDELGIDPAGFVEDDDTDEPEVCNA